MPLPPPWRDRDPPAVVEAQGVALAVPLLKAVREALGVTALELPMGVDEAQGVALEDPLLTLEGKALGVTLSERTLEPEGRGELEGEGDLRVLALLSPLRLGVESPVEEAMGLTQADGTEDVEGWG